MGCRTWTAVRMFWRKKTGLWRLPDEPCYLCCRLDFRLGLMLWIWRKQAKPSAPNCFPHEFTRWHSRNCDTGSQYPYDVDVFYGLWNTEWILSTACETLGAATTLWSHVSQAYWYAFQNGVHGIGGYHGLSNWRSEAWDRGGGDIASDFWDALATSPMSEAWDTTKEEFSYSDDRLPSYFSAEDCDCTLSSCTSRMDYDYHYINSAGPMPDIFGSAVTSTCFVTYE